MRQLGWIVYQQPRTRSCDEVMYAAGRDKTVVALYDIFAIFFHYDSILDSNYIISTLIFNVGIARMKFVNLASHGIWKETLYMDETCYMSRAMIGIENA